MSVICGISTCHLIDTSAPSPDWCRAVLCMSAWSFLSLTGRAERQMWCEGAVQGNTEGVEGHWAESQRQFRGAEWNIGSVLELAGQSAAAL